MHKYAAISLTISISVVMLLLMLSTASAEPVSCKYKEHCYGATFDLSPLIMPPFSSYNVDDSTSTSPSSYIYVFNICDRLEFAPAQSCPQDESTLAPAYQISQDQSQCYRLSNSTQEMKFKILTPKTLQNVIASSTTPVNNPLSPIVASAFGVSLTYQHGDRCGVNGAYRNFTIHFVCTASLDDEAQPAPINDVQEKNTCQYEIIFPSIYACPQECPVGSNNKLCSGHGICSYDSDHGAPRCFCNDGFGGADCAQTVTNSATPTESALPHIGLVGIALVITCVVLVMLIMATFLVFLKIRKMPTWDGENKESLSLPTFHNFSSSSRGVPPPNIFTREHSHSLSSAVDDISSRSSFSSTMANSSVITSSEIRRNSLDDDPIKFSIDGINLEDGDDDIQDERNVRVMSTNSQGYGRLNDDTPRFTIA